MVVDSEKMRNTSGSKRPDEPLVPRILVSSVLGNMLSHKTEVYLASIDLCQFVATISGLILTASLGFASTEAFITSSPLVKLGMLTIIGSSLLTIIFALITIEPNLKKDRDSNSFDYGSSIENIDTAHYVDVLKRTVADRNKIIETYGFELHKLDLHILSRYRMIKSTILIFLIGLFLGGVMIIISTFLASVQG